MGQDTAAVMASGFLHLFVSQVATRLITFVLTLLTARLLSVEGYGFASVQLHLVNTTILLLSREGFRRGCVRVHEGKGSTQRLVATASLCWPLGLTVTAAVCAVSLWRDQSQTGLLAVLLQGLAAMAELAAEPMYLLAQAQLRFRLRVTLEAAANIAKAASILVLLRLQLASELIALCLSQVAFGTTILLGYTAAYFSQGMAWLRQGRQRAQHRDEDQETGLVDWRVLRLCGTFTLQAAEKLVLAEGSKLVMVLFQSSYNQGVYGLVVNLGSLVVRTVFQPFEEAAFLAFSRQAAGQQSASSMQRSSDMLAAAVKGAMAVGLLAAAFGPAYAYLALRIVYGRGWSETAAPVALALYSPYICLLAVNGILEAFQHAVASPSQLAQSNAWLIGFSVTHVAVSIGLVNALGSQGLILADGFNMIVRIMYSLWFVGQYREGLGAGKCVGLVLVRGSLLAYGGAFAVSSLSNWVLLGAPGQLMTNCGPGCPIDGFWGRAAVHISVGAGLLLTVLLTVHRCERQLLSSLQAVRRKQE